MRLRMHRRAIRRRARQSAGSAITTRASLRGATAIRCGRRVRVICVRRRRRSRRRPLHTTRARSRSTRPRRRRGCSTWSSPRAPIRRPQPRPTSWSGAAARAAVCGARSSSRRRRIASRSPTIPRRAAGLACPTDPAVYVPTADKRGNRWAKIDAAGCVETADAGGAFHATTHCGLAAFAGWCFLDNVSQDEYSGHLFALGAVARLVDDPELRAIALDLLDQIGRHLVGHGMEFDDWDGRTTQYGKLFPDAGGDTPGYLAVLGASFVATTARSTGDPTLATAYARLAAANAAYLDQIAIWSGGDGCTSNWNDISMLTSAFHHLMWNDSAASRAPFLAAFARELVTPANARGILAERTAWYDVMWAAQTPLGPGTDGPADAAVEDAVCQLGEFPRSNHQDAHDA